MSKEEAITIKNIINQLDDINQDLKKWSRIKDRQKRILATVAKIVEEFGELSNEVLSLVNLQRKEKITVFKKKNLEKEYSDVLITLLLLGIVLNLDIEKALLNRIKEIKKRKILD